MRHILLGSTNFGVLLLGGEVQSGGIVLFYGRSFVCIDNIHIVCSGCWNEVVARDWIEARKL